jgi:hypothetical protein
MTTSRKMVVMFVVLALLASVAFAYARTARSCSKAKAPQASMMCPMCGHKCPMGMRDKMMGGMMGMGGMMHQPVMIMDGDHIYVFRGNELIKFNKDTLEIAKRTMVPPAAPMGMNMGGPGMGMGMSKNMAPPPGCPMAPKNTPPCAR